MDEGQERIRQNIQKLVADYNNLLKSKGRDGLEALSEANVRADFIDPLFEILGWNTRNPDEYDREHYVRKVGLADVVLKLDGTPVVFVEAKRFGGIPHIDKRGDADWTLEERQVILYAASSKCKWAVLTNFEKFRVFNALTGLTIIDFESVYDYTDRFGELLYLTRDSVETGRIERLAAREVKPDIDLEFLNLLNNWRILLANDIYQRNKDNDVLKSEGQLDLEKLKDAVQRTLDRLIIIRWAEDHLVLDDPNLLERKYHDWKSSPTYNSIFDSLFADRALFDKFNDIHDGKIFERGHICEKVKISDDVLGNIIHEMCQRSFRKFDFDILGNTYETYLGNTLYLKDDGTLSLKPSMETRKEAGIYYTPPYVVDYIVKNTLGELLKGKTPEDVAKIKALDPACGSGSFLIKAFDYLKDYYEKENEKVRKRKEKLIKEYMKSSGNQLSLDIEALEHKEYKDVEKEILKNNIHGVDLDRQAAEIASVNLMLKALKPKEKLPLILDENIKVGNSLISGTEDELKQYFGDDWKEKRPFNWEEEFKDVFEQGGFDVVIGNPPYVDSENMVKNMPKEREYIASRFSTTKGNWDLYIPFYELAYKLLKVGGIAAFITPNKWLSIGYGYELRKMLDKHISRICDCSIIKVFKDAGNSPVIIFLKKGVQEQKIKTEYFNENYTIKDGDIIPSKLIRANNFGILLSRNLSLLMKIRSIKTNVCDFCNVENPFTVSEAYILKNHMTDNKTEKQNLKFINTGTIDRYRSLWGVRVTSYIKDKFQSPYVDAESFKKAIPKRYTQSTSSKIIISGIRHFECYLDEEGEYVAGKSTTIIRESEGGLKLKPIVAILNSKLLDFYIKQSYNALGIDGGINFSSEMVGNLPMPQINQENQTILTELVDKMLSLNKQLNSINTDFDHYVNLHPRIEDALLKHYVDKLPANDVEVLKDHLGRSMNRVEGKFKEFDVLEEGDWLVFKVGYLLKTKKGKETHIRNVRAFRCRIADEKLRKFLYYSIKEYTRPGKLGKGNIYEKLLKIKIPQFVPNAEKNKRIIDEIMTPFLEEVAKREKLEKEIEETDRTIDEMVYELYGLSEEEIKVIEGMER